MKNFLGISAKIALGLVLALALLELLLRVLPTCNLPLTTSKSTQYVSKPILPNQDVLYSRGWMFQIGNKVEINSAGFHSGTEYARRQDGSAVAFVGDSMIENIMVDSGHLLHPVLERKFKNSGADVSVYSFGNSGSGMGDIVNFMRMASEKYNVKNFVIKFDRNGILDDLRHYDGHFCYVENASGGAGIKLFPKNTAYEKLKNVAIVRYIFSNIQLTPGSFLEKLKAALGIKKDNPKLSPDKSPSRLSKDENILLDAFIGDVLKIVGNNPKRVLFLLRGADAKELLTAKFKSAGFETLDVDAVTKSESEASLSHFHNDLHWNATGIGRICSAIEKTKFFHEIAKLAPKAK